jgi:hypothetical protein
MSGSRTSFITFAVGCSQTAVTGDTARLSTSNPDYRPRMRGVHAINAEWRSGPCSGTIRIPRYPPNPPGARTIRCPGRSSSWTVSAGMRENCGRPGCPGRETVTQLDRGTDAALPAGIQPRNRRWISSTISFTGTRTCSSESRSRRVTALSWAVSASMVMHQGVPISSCRR